MQKVVTLGLQVLRRVCDFLAMNEVKPTVGVIAKYVVELTGVVERMSAYAAGQEASDRAYRAMAFAAKLKARRLRRVYLRPLAELGKTVFPGEPTLRQTLAMPENRGYERLLPSAQAMVDRVVEHRERLVAAGLGENFVDEVREVMRDLRVTIDARSMHLGHRAGASRGMVRELKRGRSIVRLLDSMVGPWLEETDPSAKAEWETLTRFARATPAEKPETAPAAPVAVPTPTPSEITQTTPRENAA